MINYETVFALWARRYNKNVSHADEYGEPRRSATERGILFANWNDVPMRIQDGLAAQGFALEWADEWYVDKTRNPCRAYRTEPDSYNWQPSLLYCDDFVLTPDDPLSEWIEECADDEHQRLPVRYEQREVEAEGWRLLDREYATGIHAVEGESPVDVACRMRQAGDRFLFQVSETNPFYARFRVYTDKLHWASSLYGFCLDVRAQDVRYCAHQGDCSEDLAQLARTDYMRVQLDRLDPCLVRRELQECGAWSPVELVDHEENIHRLLWVTTGYLRDSLIG